jgi:hypothetical protein
VAQPVGWIVTEEAAERPGLLPVLSNRSAVRAAPTNQARESGMSTSCGAADDSTQNLPAQTCSLRHGALDAEREDLAGHPAGEIPITARRGRQRRPIEAAAEPVEDHHDVEVLMLIDLGDDTPVRERIGPCATRSRRSSSTEATACSWLGKLTATPGSPPSRRARRTPSPSLVGGVVVGIGAADQRSFLVTAGCS